jgi:diphthamide synthase (EF-2-diphthine--ammonia ligase)
MNVKDVTKRKKSITQPVLIGFKPDKSYTRQSVLFWSGGKDSFLTYLHLRDTNPQTRIILLTTFDAVSQRVPIQDISLNDVMAQAKAMGLALMAVPLLKGQGYEESVRAALEMIEGRTGVSGTLVFGGDFMYL